MVRVNLISPRKLTDQHLIAEYNEILMLVGYVRKFPKCEGVPENYRLGKGHIKFFKNKLVYLKKRHAEIKEEMRRRKFKPVKMISLKGFPKEMKKDYRPDERDFRLIKGRLVEKIKRKPDYYNYYGKSKSRTFLINLIKSPA
jgi:deoxyribonuclease (pyrimidine dimer)